MLPLLVLSLLGDATGFGIAGFSLEMRCPSQTTYNVVVNAASEIYGRSSMITLSMADKTVATIVLILMASAGFLLCLLGSKLLKLCTTLLTLAVSFFGLLYLLQWIVSEALNGDNAAFTVCWLPLIAAGVGALLIACIVLCIYSKIECLVTFLMGASLGFFAALEFRTFIIAADVGIATSAGFKYFWLAAAGAALVCGLLSCWMHKSVVAVATSFGGAYMFATGIMGLLQAYVDSGVSGWVFQAIFWPMFTIGFLVQFKVFKGGSTPKKRKIVQA